MPQASDELRDSMRACFGSIDSHGPQRYLVDAGYKLTHDWLWEPKPGVVDYGRMTRDEFECLMFLMHEWDYGGLTTMERMRKQVDSELNEQKMEDVVAYRT